MKLASEPAGAQVIYEGKEIGITPSFVEIPRARKNKITLKFDERHQRTLDLETSYRWSDSFFSNFVWAVIGAPIGSGIDLLTGSVWEYKKLPVITDDASKKATKISENQIDQATTTIAIAPPQASPEALSNELGERAELSMKLKYNAAHIIEFEKTRKTFQLFFYDHSEPVRKIYRDRLYYDLKNTHILETSTEKKDGFLLIRSKLTDIFRDEVVSQTTETVPYETLKSSNRSLWQEGLSMLSSLIPNTISIDFTYSNLVFEEDSSVSSNPYIPVTDDNQSISKFLTYIGLRNSRSPKLTELKGVFRLIPDFNFYYQKFHFDRAGPPNRLDGQSFTWYSISSGFGVEGGLESPIGYLYLDVVPSLALDWVTSPAQTATQWGITLHGEIGYQIFIAQYFAIRLFSRAVYGSASDWSKLLSNAAQESIQLKNVSQGIYGISIGYYIPEAKAAVKSLFQ